MNPAELEMKKYLGLPHEYKATFNSMYTVATRLEEMTGTDQGPTIFGLIWWLDKYGNFTEKKDIYSKMVNQIFMGMGSEMTKLFPFIELCANNYIEEEDEY